MSGERNQVSKTLFKGFYAMNASFLKHFPTEMFCQILVGFFDIFFFFNEMKRRWIFRLNLAEKGSVSYTPSLF